MGRARWAESRMRTRRREEEAVRGPGQGGPVGGRGPRYREEEVARETRWAAYPRSRQKTGRGRAGGRQGRGLKTSLPAPARFLVREGA